MKIIVTSSGEISAELEGDLGENFNAIADFQEVFGHKSCGKCGSVDLRYGVRKNQDNEFREIICKNPECRAKLAFGSNKKGGEFFLNEKMVTVTGYLMVAGLDGTLKLKPLSNSAV